jgi:NADPH:quinone reductase-like Zn-dependent oxidoreductase
MKAAVVLEAGKAPSFCEFDDPVPLAGEVVVTVTASALTHFTKIRAQGGHFSFNTRPPFVAGIDGVGKLADGRRVYFLFPRIPFGGMAQKTVVRSSQCVAVPDEVDDITLAAIADPGMSAWVALESRAKLAHGESVLVNGATGSAGCMAVQIARHLGAGKIIATGRNREALDSLLALGADKIIALEHDGKPLEMVLREQFEQGVDIVLDYLWGSSAERILAAASAAKEKDPIRFVQIGTASAPSIALPGTVLRSSTVQIIGSGFGSASLEEIMVIMAKLMQATAVVNFKIATTMLPLCRVEEAWSMGNGPPRVVLAMNS